MPAALASTTPSALDERRQAPRDGGEFAMTAADFERVRKLIYQHAGISLSEGKRTMVYSRLSRRLRETSHTSFGDYLNWLSTQTGPRGDAECQAFVNCLTTNLTAFFREEHHFPVLAAELVARRNAPLRLWCNAASTGEEPYSLAMTVLEALGPRANASIVASDIDTEVLATAGRGVYDAAARGLDAARLRRHFMRGKGENNSLIRVKPELQALIEFRQLNLMHERWSLDEPFDIVFCRNVMIYFDSPTQRRLLERMHRVMKPGSLLFAGHSENFSDARNLFRLRAKTVYERV